MPFSDLSDHLKETIDYMDGFTTGTLFVEEGLVGLMLDNATEMLLDDTYFIEVRNGDEYVKVTAIEALERKTWEGWHLYAGLYARVKKY